MTEFTGLDLEMTFHEHYHEVRRARCGRPGGLFCVCVCVRAGVGVDLNEGNGGSRLRERGGETEGAVGNVVVLRLCARVCEC
eukprot:1740321-Pleurochrysis_carterae.AAC.1